MTHATREEKNSWATAIFQTISVQSAENFVHANILLNDK